MFREIHKWWCEYRIAVYSSELEALDELVESFDIPDDEAKKDKAFFERMIKHYKSKLASM